MTPLYAKSVARSHIARRISARVSDSQGCPGSCTLCTVQAGASIGDATITPTRTVRSRSTVLLEDIAEFSNMFLECGVCHRAISPSRVYSNPVSVLTAFWSGNRSE